MKGKSNNFELDNPPEERISSVKFIPSSGEEGEENLVATVSWDGMLKVYNFKKNALVFDKICSKEGVPLLALTATNSSTVSFGGLDKKVYVKTIDDTSGLDEEATCIGVHDDTVSSLGYCDFNNTIVSAGWDSTIRLWSSQTKPHSTTTIKTGNKVFCISARGHLIAAGLAGGYTCIWDVRNHEKPLKYSSIKDDLNLQCIAIFPDLKRFIFGTYEGKASIETTAENDVSSKVFSFKAQLDKSTGIAHPVNAVCFGRNSSRFLLGGSDGKLRLWDPDTRKLAADFTQYPNQIASVDISPSDSYAAIACSYQNDREGVCNPPSPSLYIRNISEYIK